MNDTNGTLHMMAGNRLDVEVEEGEIKERLFTTYFRNVYGFIFFLDAKVDHEKKEINANIQWIQKGFAERTKMLSIKSLAKKDFLSGINENFGCNFDKLEISINDRFEEIARSLRMLKDNQ